MWWWQCSGGGSAVVVVAVVGINYENVSRSGHSTAPVTPVGCTMVASVSSYTPAYCSSAASLQHHAMLHICYPGAGVYRPPTKDGSPPGDQQ